MAMIAVRPATPDDLPALVDLFLGFFDYLKETVADAFWRGAVADPALAAAFFEKALAEGELLLLAETGRVPVGYLAGRIEPALVQESPIRSVGHISHCYVSPRARGQGAGSALVEAAEGWFRARHIAFVELGYSLANDTAARFWTARGYAPDRVIARKAIG